MNWYRLAAEDVEYWIGKLNEAYLEMYGLPLDPGAADHYRKSADPNSAKRNYELLQQNKEKIRREQEAETRRKEMNRHREQDALQTAADIYYRVEGSVERVVCNAPDLHKKGMPAYKGDLAEVDPELKGYFAVHVGDADEWLPVLVRDGYCDGPAYIYQILCSESQEPFYEMEDYHVMDKTEAPSGTIVFSKYPVIPPQLIRLVKVVEDPQTAPDPFPEQSYPGDENPEE